MSAAIYETLLGPPHLGWYKMVFGTRVVARNTSCLLPEYCSTVTFGIIFKKNKKKIWIICKAF